jgi:hypothetical protein
MERWELEDLFGMAPGTTHRGDFASSWIPLVGLRLFRKRFSVKDNAQGGAYGRMGYHRKTLRPAGRAVLGRSVGRATTGKP